MGGRPRTSYTRATCTRAAYPRGALGECASPGGSGTADDASRPPAAPPRAEGTRAGALRAAGGAPLERRLRGGIGEGPVEEPGDHSRAARTSHSRASHSRASHSRTSHSRASDSRAAYSFAASTS